MSKPLSSLALLCALPVLCTPVNAQTPDPDYHLYLTSAVAEPGETVAVGVILDFPNGLIVVAGSWGICATPTDAVELPCTTGPTNDCVANGAVVQGEDLMAINDGDGACFFAIANYDSGWTCGFVTSLNQPIDSLPPGADQELAVVLYEVGGSPGTTVELSFCGTLGNPNVPVSIEHEQGPVVPLTTDGTIEILVDAFLRGDADGDGAFSALVDVLYLLSFAFLGGPEPPCLEAADVDGNAQINGLIDAVYGLQHGFNGGPPPPAPFPVCGDDPEPESTLPCIVDGCP